MASARLTAVDVADVPASAISIAALDVADLSVCGAPTPSGRLDDAQEIANKAAKTPKKRNFGSRFFTGERLFP